MPPKSEGLLESSLYVDDVEASARFYERIFGFLMISDFGERGCAMQAGNCQVLLLLRRVVRC
jgi:catechol 2,3-dioxygenase-like lactoylglutathione lyase family enzyme